MNSKLASTNTMGVSTLSENQQLIHQLRCCPAGDKNEIEGLTEIAHTTKTFRSGILNSKTLRQQ